MENADDRPKIIFGGARRYSGVLACFANRGLFTRRAEGKKKLSESEGRQAERREEKDRREHVLKKHTAELEKGVGAER